MPANVYNLNPGQSESLSVAHSIGARKKQKNSRPHSKNDQSVLQRILKYNSRFVIQREENENSSDEPLKKDDSTKIENQFNVLTKWAQSLKGEEQEKGKPPKGKTGINELSTELIQIQHTNDTVLMKFILEEFADLLRENNPKISESQEQGAEQQQVVQGCWKYILAFLLIGLTIAYLLRPAIRNGRRRRSVLDGVIGQVGHMNWVAGSSEDIAARRHTASDFTNWIYSGGAQPTNSSKMNCWEFVLFGAFRAGVINKNRITTIYNRAGQNQRDRIKSTASTIYDELGKGKRKYIYSRDDGGWVNNHGDPKAGDLVYFNIEGKHVAIATGVRREMRRNQHGPIYDYQVISLLQGQSGGKGETTWTSTLLSAPTGGYTFIWAFTPVW